jgi:hypothetical protein
MNNIFSVLLPPQDDNRIHGSQLPFYALILITIIGTARSFIHLLAPDGSSGSIAGMGLSGTGEASIIFSFALWGSAQTFGKCFP